MQDIVSDVMQHHGKEIMVMIKTVTSNLLEGLVIAKA